MRKLIIVLAVPTITLSACSTTTQTTIATDSTKAVIAADESYAAAEKFGASLVAAGTLDKAKFQSLDTTAYTALTLLRAAQATGTATDVTTATANFSVAVAAIYALKGN